MTRLGIACGGHMDTFMGLSGVGDLMVTCYSHHSRNQTAGRLIAKGTPEEVCQVPASYTGQFLKPYLTFSGKN